MNEFSYKTAKIRLMQRIQNVYPISLQNLDLFRDIDFGLRKSNSCYILTNVR